MPDWETTGNSVTLTADGGANGDSRWSATIVGQYIVTANVDDVNRITESLEDNNTLSASFSVFNTNNPPVLAPIPDKTVNAGALLTFTATATDTNIPAQTLTFSLDPGCRMPSQLILNRTNLATINLSPD